MTGHLVEITDRRGNRSVQARVPLRPRNGKKRYLNASFAEGKYGPVGKWHKALAALDALRKGRRVER